MISHNSKPLDFDWISQGKLAVGRAPSKEEHFSFLKSKKIEYILSVCHPNENRIPSKVESEFRLFSFPLKDHNSKEEPTEKEYVKAIKLLIDLTQRGVVYIHCLAGIERSPLTCIGWLILVKGLDPDDAYEYCKEIHPSTSPLLSHFKILKKAISKMKF